MIRKIIRIDAEICNGCGACATACHEGAIAMRSGKAELIRDDYCDGLGDCLPACPVGAISFEKREALPYDEKAVLENMRAASLRMQAATAEDSTPSCGCDDSCCKDLSSFHEPLMAAGPQRHQWPVQLRLIPEESPVFDNADLLIAADCAAYVHPDFHKEYMQGKVVAIGCPKLDGVNYGEKLAAIFSQHTLASVTVVRMSVPCCSPLARAAETALAQSGKNLPLAQAVLTPEGKQDT